MRRITMVAVGVAGCAVLGSDASAQTEPKARSRSSLVEFGLFGGASSPVGEFADGVQTGYHLGARLGVKARWLPVAAHAEVQWHRFSGDPLDASAVASTRPFDVFPVTANVDFERHIGSGSLYVTGGVGVYSRNANSVYYAPGGPQANLGFNSRFGVNAGVGGTTELGRVLGFAELRFHRVGAEDEVSTGAMSFAPISVGIRF